MAMKPERTALALQAMQRIVEPQPKPKPAPKPEVVTATVERERNHRVATLACKHIMKISRSAKQYERLWCTTCRGWQNVTRISKP